MVKRSLASTRILITLRAARRSAGTVSRELVGTKPMWKHPRSVSSLPASEIIRLARLRGMESSMLTGL